MNDVDVTCPHCGRHRDGCTGVKDDEGPEVGAIAFCFDCGGIAEFDEDLQLREISPDRYLALPDDVRLAVARMSREIIQYQEAK